MPEGELVCCFWDELNAFRYLGSAVYCRFMQVQFAAGGSSNDYLNSISLILLSMIIVFLYGLL